MRIRCTKVAFCFSEESLGSLALMFSFTQGLTMHTFHGHFFVRSADLLTLSNVSPDNSYAFQINVRLIYLYWRFLFSPVSNICIRLMNHSPKRAVGLVIFKQPCFIPHHRATGVFVCTPLLFRPLRTLRLFSWALTRKPLPAFTPKWVCYLFLR
jgi:hypothetical protein